MERWASSSFFHFDEEEKMFLKNITTPWANKTQVVGAHLLSSPCSQRGIDRSSYLRMEQARWWVGNDCLLIIWGFFSSTVKSFFTNNDKWKQITKHLFAVFPHTVTGWPTKQKMLFFIHLSKTGPHIFMWLSLLDPTYHVMVDCNYLNMKKPS